MDRYTVTLTPDGRRYGILDREMYAYCTLLDQNSNLLPLEWDAKERAQDWLKKCYAKWQAWEADQKAAKLVPVGWRPHPPALSPWDHSRRRR